MSYKDKLKKSQRGNFNDAPKLTIAYNFDIKEHPTNGKICFSFWDKAEEEEEKTQKFSSKSITGIFLGAALKLTAFSQELGKNGGTYYTSIYFKNTDIVTLFAPGNDGKSIKKFSGNIEAVKSFLVNSRCQPKVHRCLYMLTKNGLAKIETNVTIAIDQLNKIEKELTEKKITLTPMLFDPESKTISKRGKEFLSKLAIKNPPKYAEITLGSEITDQEAEEWGIEAAIDEFVAWKEYKETSGNATDTDKNDPAVARVADAHGNESPFLNNGQRDLGKVQESTKVDEVEDDLPF